MSGGLETHPEASAGNQTVTARADAAVSARIGVALVAISALGFGFMALFKSWASPPASTETLLALRFSIASVMLALFAKWRGVPWPRGRTLGTLVFMGAGLYFGEAACYFFAIDAGAPSGLVSLLLYLYPGMVAGITWLLWRERLSRGMIVAIVLGLVGSALTVGPIGLGGPSGSSATVGAIPIAGIVLGVGTALTYATYIVVGSRLPASVSPIAASAIVTGGAAVSFCVMSLARGVQMPQGIGAWTGVLGLTLVSTVVSITALLAGMARIGAVRASALSVIEPATTVLVGWLLLSEELTWLRAFGAGLVLFAAVVAARSGRRDAAK